MPTKQNTRITVATALLAVLAVHAERCLRTPSQQLEMILVILYGNQDELLPKYREAAATLRAALSDFSPFADMHERMVQLQAEIHARQQAAEGAQQ